MASVHCNKCASGVSHTITLSDEGVVHSFGQNDKGQLGLGHNNNVDFPTPIVNLPQIKQVSCGVDFTVCVDEDGFIWSFGKNFYGQLGTGTQIYSNLPQKILDIPLVISVSCGLDHTCIITIDSDLWSCGGNKFGQLCLGSKLNQLQFKKTSFSNISRVSCGYYNTLFQSDEGEIFSCGNNAEGQLGLGHFQRPSAPSLIPNLPSNIVQFVCGYYHKLFLDCEGMYILLEATNMVNLVSLTTQIRVH